eukprot:TRINITY_DN5219_c0_g1_i10.p2 TRINITY_DN5219_c0_g1~~TRINITY_DN5219_c0_g1_i10.p2  ORF type:complete len:104 (-),score=17.02 TRINITY_DN5219_c0_g1_i10:269-580(-)
MSTLPEPGAPQEEEVGEGGIPIPQSPRRRERMASPKAQAKATAHTGGAVVTCKKCGESYRVMCYPNDYDSVKFRTKMIAHEQGCNCHLNSGDGSCGCATCVVC